METEVIISEFKKINDSILELTSTVNQLKLILQNVAKLVLGDDRTAKCVDNSQLMTQEELDKQTAINEENEIRAARLEILKDSIENKFNCLIPAQAPFECLDK